MTFRTRIFRVELPLARAILVKGGRSESRTILRVEREAPDGRLTWADCSPLPGFHGESLEACVRAAQNYVATEYPVFPAPIYPVSSSPVLGPRPDPRHSLSSLPVSLRTTIEILEWQRVLPEPKPIFDRFENSALLRLPERADYEAAIESVAEARVCKVKIGAADPGRVREFLMLLAGARSDRELRIDCNQDVGTMDVASLKRLIQGLPVAWVEEPGSNPSVLKGLAKALPIALDESLGLDRELDSLAKAWVIKPNCLGWEETLRRFSDPGPQHKVLSNVWESLGTLQLYAWAYRQTVAKPVACGLGTAFYMAEVASSQGWNSKTYCGPWPETPLSPRVKDHREVLIWES